MKALLAGLLFFSVPVYAADVESAAVLKAVQGLLDGWREADPAKVDAVLHPDFREVTYHLRDGKWEFSPVTRDTLVGLAHKVPKGRPVVVGYFQVARRAQEQQGQRH